VGEGGFSNLTLEKPRRPGEVFLGHTAS
jgi:hypothetical protein